MGISAKNPVNKLTREKKLTLNESLSAVSAYVT